MLAVAGGLPERWAHMTWHSSMHTRPCMHTRPFAGCFYDLLVVAAPLHHCDAKVTLSNQREAGAPLSDPSVCCGGCSCVCRGSAAAAGGASLGHDPRTAHVLASDKYV